MFVANIADMKVKVYVFVIFLSLSLATVIPATEERHKIGSFERVRELIKSNKFSEALQALSSRQPSSEDFSLYHSLYAQALAQSSRLYESIEHYRLAYLYAATDAEKERLLLERANVYVKMNYFSEAALCFDMFLTKFPKSAAAEQAHLGIAEARYRTGDYHEALMHFEKTGGSFRSLTGKANTLQALGRTREAHELYRRLLEKELWNVNASQETLFNMGDNFRLMGKRSDARIYLTSIKDPLFKPRAQIGLGFIALEEGNYDAAMDFFGAAADTTDRQARRQALLLKAEAALKIKKEDEAIAALQELRSSQPYGKEYDAALLMLTRICKKQGKSEEAVTYLKELLHRRTPPVAALDELESVLMEAKDRNPAEFLKLWNSIGRWLMDPPRHQALLALARGLRYSGKPFLNLCSWLIKNGPEDVKSQSRLLLADFYAGLGDATAATNYLTRAQTKGQNDEVARVMAKIASITRDYEKASEALMRIRLPREEDVRMLLTILETMQDVPLEAIAFCDQAFQKKAAAASTAIRFADVLYALEMDDEALRYYRAALEAQVEVNSKATEDREWAQYRISFLTSGKERSAALAALGKSPGFAGRIAALNMKGSALQGKGW